MRSQFGTWISRESQLSLTTQIQGTIREEILSGALYPGTRLPSSRCLAEDLGVSRSVVVEAYSQLIAEGFLEAVQGSGTRVAPHMTSEPAVPTLLDDEPAPSVLWDLRTGTAGPSNFPHRDWLACYERALRSSDLPDLGYPPLSGAQVLREELTRYLGRVRGVVTTPGQVMVIGGFAHALGLMCALFLDMGIGEMGIEDPCHHGQRQFIAKVGLVPRPVPVDDEGIDVGALARTGVRAVLVTPAHQFPRGVTMTAERRAALARWARATDAWIIEDDYDGDLWHERSSGPLALQRLVPERTVYGGTVSKSLVPGLRLGWMAVPSVLVAPIERLRSSRDLGQDIFTQLAFAELLRSGRFDRHLRKQRTRYRLRRRSLEQSVHRYLPEARLSGSPAGLHAYLRLPRHVDEAALVRGALQRSVLVRGGRRFHARPERAEPALVMGYTVVPRSGIVETAQALRDTLAELSAGRKAPVAHWSRGVNGLGVSRSSRRTTDPAGS